MTMPLPRVRFTARRIMVAVAAVAICLAMMSRLSDRSARFHALARRHYEEVKDSDYFDPNFRDRRRFKPKFLWHVRMMEKYKSAAWFPFLPVLPDPPEPE